MKNLFFYLLLGSFSLLFACGGGDDPEPSLAEKISLTWKVQSATENGAPATFSTTGFSITFTIDPNSKVPTTYSVTPGGAPKPNYKNSGNTGTWSLNTTGTEITFDAGGNASKAKIVGTPTATALSLEWTDDRDKTAVVYRYNLVR
jgi:hypothetical protein